MRTLARLLAIAFMLALVFSPAFTKWVFRQVERRAEYKAAKASRVMERMFSDMQRREQERLKQQQQRQKQQLQKKQAPQPARGRP